MEHEHVHGPDCDHDHENMSEIEVLEHGVFAANDKIEALVRLLIEKKLITEDELQKTYENLIDEYDDVEEIAEDEYDADASAEDQE